MASGRHPVRHARVSTPKQKADLENQLQDLKTFALSKGYQITGAFKDIASGVSFEKRHEFFKLLDLVINHKVSKIIVTSEDRLSRTGFDMLKQLFDQYHVDIITTTKLADSKTDQQELVAEMTALFETFNMKLTTKQRNQIKTILNNKD